VFASVYCYNDTVYGFTYCPELPAPVTDPFSSAFDWYADANFHPTSGTTAVSNVAVSLNTVALVQNDKLYVYGACSEGQTGVAGAGCVNGTRPLPTATPHPCDGPDPPYTLDPTLLDDTGGGAVDLSSFPGAPRLVAAASNFTVVVIGNSACHHPGCSLDSDKSVLFCVVYARSNRDLRRVWARGTVLWCQQQLGAVTSAVFPIPGWLALVNHLRY
jgi:hypothetical protein